MTTLSDISQAQGLEPVKCLDFLVAIRVDDSQVQRTERGFRSDRPWADARFGAHTLRPGWWKFECDAEPSHTGVELHLSSPADPLILMPGLGSACFYLRGGEPFDISLRFSPWPFELRFETLRLRRLSPLEEWSVISSGLLRLLRGGAPLARVGSVLRRLASGQSIGLRLGPSKVHTPASASPNATTGPAEHVVAPGPASYAILRSDDVLHPRAFDIVEREFARQPGLSAIYADRCEAGEIRPRPQWDEELARHAQYVQAPVFLRRPPEGPAAAPWDVISRIVVREGPQAVTRIALPLAAGDQRAGAPLSLVSIPTIDAKPLVSIIIPTKYQVALLRKCLEGIALKTDYREVEVVIVDNGCDDPEFLPMLESMRALITVIRVEDRGDFNFPRLIDAGVQKSSGRIILLLNDDVEPIDRGWLNRMVEAAMQQQVGAVGARLVYPDGSIQHAGVMLGLGGVCGHLWKGVEPSEAQGNPQIVLPGTRMAVTGACLAVRRELYDSVGGLNAADFPVALNDIDFCLRLRLQGYRTIYRGDAVLIHHESKSRGTDDATTAKRKRLARETRAFLARWRCLILDDPYASPAYDRRFERGQVHTELLRSRAR